MTERCATGWCQRERFHGGNHERSTSIIRNLGRGRDAARSISDYAEAWGVSRRQIEQELQDAVQAGIPVVSCERGVYIAQTPQEARAYAQSLRGRIVAVQARISALERWADEQESGLVQTALWEAA